MNAEKQTFITDDGVELAYFVSGSGERTAVLLAGYGAPAISWGPQIDALNEAGIRTIALDRRCHGASERTEKGMNMLRHGKDVGELFEHLDLHDVILIGQSQGASTMWSFIKQFGTSRLSAVISVDQTPKMINEGDWQCGMVGLTPETRPTYFDTPLAAPNKKPIDTRIVMAIVQFGKDYVPFDQAATKDLLLSHADADWRDVVAGTDVPVFFIAGEGSPYWPPKHAEEMAKLAPKGSFYVMPGSGHAVNWECVDEFNQVVLDYIKNLEA